MIVAAVRAVAHIALIVLLTVLTQTGGLAYLFALIGARFFRRRAYARTAIFAAIYIGLSLANTWIAPSFGRVPLPFFAGESRVIAPTSPLYCLFNRHYVRPQLRDTAIELAAHMNPKFPDTITATLDGNFPYLNGFPLLPHLSHSDGRKLDLSFYYQDASGDYLPGGTRSPIGYFAFEMPRRGDPQPCGNKPSNAGMRWDLDWLQPLWPQHILDEPRMREAIRWLATTGRGRGVSKIFLEPHLARRLGVSGPTIRFQGCRAARHDDHIHFQVAR